MPRLSENAHLLRLSAFGGLHSSLVPPGRRPSRPEALRRTSLYASFLAISEALHMSIFHQPLRSRVFDRLSNLLGLRKASEPKGILVFLA